MIGLFAIIARYGTIIRYYCTYYCTTIRYYSLLLFAIIVHYFSYYYYLLWQGVGTQKMGICRQQFLTQSWRNDSLVSNKNACSTALTGRRADRVESCLMERSGTIIRIIVPVIHLESRHHG